MTEHVELGDFEDTESREIANLTIGRYYHACGMYSVGKDQTRVNLCQTGCCNKAICPIPQMLIVAGGWNVEVLGSTEVLDYTKYLRTKGDPSGRRYMVTSMSQKGSMIYGPCSQVKPLPLPTPL